MVDLNRTFKGQEWDRGLAMWGPVQDMLDEHIVQMKRTARAELAKHRQTGDSFIESEDGVIDRYLILNDMRGQKAAMSIEYGRGPDEDGSNATRGLFILHHATGAAKIRTRPHSRRRKEYYE